MSPTTHSRGIDQALSRQRFQHEAQKSSSSEPFPHREEETNTGKQPRVENEGKFNVYEEGVMGKFTITARSQENIHSAYFLSCSRRPLTLHSHGPPSGKKVGVFSSLRWQRPISSCPLSLQASGSCSLGFFSRMQGVFLGLGKIQDCICGGSHPRA